MNSIPLYQIYTYFRIFVYSLMLLQWLFEPTFSNLFWHIVNISLYRFFEILFFSYFQSRRTKKLKRVAAKMDLDFYKKDKSKILPILEGMDIFERFNPRTKNFWNDCLNILDIIVWLLLSSNLSLEKIQLKNILISKQEKEGTFYAIFDYYSPIRDPKRYQYSSSYSDVSSYLSVNNYSGSKKWQTMILFADKELQLPRFSILTRKKNLCGRIYENLGKLMKYKREKREQNSQYLIPQISEFYKAEKNLCATAKGYRLIYSRANAVIKPKNIQSFIYIGFQALDLFKTTDIFTIKQDINYTKLQNLLEVGKWQEADRETTTILLKAAGEKIEGTNTSMTLILGDEIFLRPVLRNIDALWVTYSKGHFGFSVQKRLWLEIGSKVDYETECQLADEVGWRVNGKWLHYSDLAFSLDAPQGHLPTTELSKLPLGWFYLWKRPLFRVPGMIALTRWINLQACSIASKF